MSRRQTLPASLDTERTILGMLMQGGRDAVESVRADLPVDVWYRPDHMRLYVLILQLADRGPFGLTDVFDAVTRHPSGDEAFGGASYVVEVAAASWATSVVPSGLVAELADLATRRKAIAALDRAREALMHWTPGDDPSSAVATLRMELDAAESGRPTADEWDDYGELIPRMIATSIAAAEGDPSLTLGPTLPWESLRQYRGRARPGTMIVLAALQKVGKSVVARQIAEHIADQGFVAAVYSLEMDGLALATKSAAASLRLDRAIARATPLAEVVGFTARDIEEGRFDQKAWEVMEQNLSGIRSLPIRVAKRKNFTIDELIASIGRLARWAKATGKRLGLVVVDYFQLVSTVIGRGRNQSDALADASRRIKVAAMEHGVCILLVSQFNRSAADSKEGVKAHHLRGTSALESDADMVMLIERDPAAAEGIFKIPLNRGHEACPAGFRMIFDGPSESYIDPTELWY